MKIRELRWVSKAPSRASFSRAPPSRAPSSCYSYILPNTILQTLLRIVFVIHRSKIFPIGKFTDTGLRNWMVLDALLSILYLSISLNIFNMTYSKNGQIWEMLKSLANDVSIMGQNYFGLKIGANMDPSPRNLKIRRIILPKLSMWQINGILKQF